MARDAYDEVADGPGGIPGFVDPYGGASGCDGGVHVGADSCELTMPVTGGLSGVLHASMESGCDWSSAGAFGVDAHGPGPTMGAVVMLHPSMPVMPGETGVRGSVVISIDVLGVDGSMASWVTPATCSIDLVSNACAPTGTMPSLYVLSGTGTCVDGAAPYGANTAAPVTIGSFSFALEFVPPVSD